MAAPFSGNKTVQGHCGETWFSGHCERFGGKGAQIIGNHFTNGAALLGRTKSSVGR